MKGKKEILNNKNFRNIIEFIAVLTIISSPFIGITNLIGIETFLDSFEKPNDYIYLKNFNEFLLKNVKNPSHLIIQKTKNPETEIKESDTVLYSTFTGDIACDKIYNIKSIGTIKKFEIENSFSKENHEEIYEEQIIGKVVRIVEDNVINDLLIKIWSGSINNLNINTILR